MEQAGWYEALGKDLVRHLGGQPAFPLTNQDHFYDFFSHIRARLDEPETFTAKALLRRIFAGERIRFESHGGADGRLAELYLIGVIKEGPDGNCVIRNRIYQREEFDRLERALKELGHG